MRRCVNLNCKDTNVTKKIISCTLINKLDCKQIRVNLGNIYINVRKGQKDKSDVFPLPMDRVRPCLSLCLSNIISLRGCFNTYSSALCMRPKELRRRSLTPLTSVVMSLSSTRGAMPRKRGTMTRKIYMMGVGVRGEAFDTIGPM